MVSGQCYAMDYCQSFGQGTHTCPDGQKYVGEFKDCKFHGQGTATFADGFT